MTSIEETLVLLGAKALLHIIENAVFKSGDVEERAELGRSLRKAIVERANQPAKPVPTPPLEDKGASTPPSFPV